MTTGPDAVQNPEMHLMEISLAEIGHPARLLAEALAAIRAAQALSRKIKGNPGDHSTLVHEERHRRLIDEASGLAQVAQAASDLAAAERQMPTRVVDGDLDEMAMQPSPVGEPRAVQLRFTADIIGMPVGRVAGRSWVWLPGYGFIDVSDAHEYDVDDSPGYRLSGRVVSVTDEHMLGILPSGAPVCLPLELASLGPDE